MELKVVAIIPARFASTRFPGKPLADIAGVTMIERVYSRAKSIFEYVYVATDSDKIYDTVVKFGGDPIMTSADHQSGTDRIAEALDTIEKSSGERFDVVVNIQGDEPFISVKQLTTVVNCFAENSTDIATLAMRVDSTEDLFNSNVVKVVRGLDEQALYFSRSPIPFQRGVEESRWIESHEYLHHIGLYAFRADVLRAVSSLDKSTLEQCESLEQLRWLESGYSIKCPLTDEKTIGIDTPEDLERVLKSGLM